MSHVQVVFAGSHGKQMAICLDLIHVVCSDVKVEKHKEKTNKQKQNQRQICWYLCSTFHIAWDLHLSLTE